MNDTEQWLEAVEECHRRGWTDGLPVIPPTPELVARMVDVVPHSGDDLVGTYVERSRPVLVEKVAANAVMAGCLPEHFPVVLAIVTAMLTVDFPTHVANTSTGSPAIGFVVNGPIRHALGMNYQGNVLGPGNRANSSIGRAVRLTQMNVLGSIPGAGAAASVRPVLDRATMGQPGKYAGYHLVEFEEAQPAWEPCHVQRGFRRDDSAVTVFYTWGHMMLSNHAEESPEEWIASTAQYVVGHGRLNVEGFSVLAMPPESAEKFADAGWSKSDVASALFDQCSRSVGWIRANGWKIGGRFERGTSIDGFDDSQVVSIASSPADVYVVVAGGPAGNFPVYLSSFAGAGMSSRAVKCRSDGRNGEQNA